MPLILIADDDPACRSLIRKTLPDPTFVFIEVKSGQRTLALARDYQPDLAILDIRIASPNGIQLCQLMRADRDLQATRVLLLTTRRSAAERASAFYAGCDAYLTKPCEADRLRATVARLLSREARQYD